ncbi:hypothetical protein DFJ74DRAFT_685206 [Hyaloraphidium curvatum]|nr:hypothetical protein DFJ74DRAFT_685206 [Hyaloraphidium curvatum]
MAGPAYRRLSICGPKCSMCCIIMCIFCLFFAVIWGALFYTGQDMVRRGIGLQRDYQAIGISCFGAAGIDVFFILCCSCQWWLRQKLIKDEQKLNAAAAPSETVPLASAAASAPPASQ